MNKTAVATGSSDLLATTRFVMAVIIPVLVAAFVLLCAFPGDTPELWAWTIAPQMTSLSMGGGYLAGALFFLMAVRARWGQIALGFVAAIAFTSMLLIATIIHWEKFNHDHVSFWAWLGLYILTPVLLPVLFLVNQRAATDVARPRVEVPQTVRAAMGVSGSLMGALGVVLFVKPTILIERSAWVLTPLTARTLVSFSIFLGVMWASYLFESDWYRLELGTVATLAGLVLVGVGALRRTGEFVRSGASWAFAISLPAAIAALSALIISMRVATARGFGLGDSRTDVDTGPDTRRAPR